MSFKNISALLIVSSWAALSFSCLKLNESMEQETQEYSLNNVYNESFKLNESNIYDLYEYEHNEYEQYRHRYAEFPW